MHAVSVKIGTFNETLQHIDRAFFLRLIGKLAHQTVDDVTPHWFRNGGIKTIQSACFEPVIAAENFIATLAAEAHSDLSPHLATNEHQRDRREIRHWFIEMIE